MQRVSTCMILGLNLCLYLFVYIHYINDNIVRSTNEINIFVSNKSKSLIDMYVMYVCMYL